MIKFKINTKNIWWPTDIKCIYIYINLLSTHEKYNFKIAILNNCFYHKIYTKILNYFIKFLDVFNECASFQYYKVHKKHHDKFVLYIPNHSRSVAAYLKPRLIENHEMSDQSYRLPCLSKKISTEISVNNAYFNFWKLRKT